MHLTRPLTVLLAAALLATPAVPSASAAAPYDDGLSSPQEDSYYPEHGDPGIDVLHYGLDLTWRRRRGELLGVADITLRATADASSFQLDLARGMRVSRVTVDGVRVDDQHGGRYLRVESPVVADQRYDVEVTYRGRPQPVRAPTTRSDSKHVGMTVTDDHQLRTMQEPYGAFTWYPVNDQPSDKALYDLRVTTYPRHWVGVSNGRLVSRHHTARTTTTRFHLEHPTASYLMTLAVGPYAHRKATGPHGLPLTYWLPKKHVHQYMKALRHLPADLRWLESKLGRYPFESAGVVVVPGKSAMETQTLVTFGAQSWTTPAYARETLVHELAHQWYGDSVTPSDWSDLWMNEGMAMYVEAQWTVDQKMTKWKRWVRFFRHYNRVDREQQGGPGAYDKDMFATGCVYYCTAMMLEKLRARLNNHTFWKLVKRWTRTQPDSNVDRAGFQAMAEDMAHQPLTSFFDDWLNSPTWPPS